MKILAPTDLSPNATNAFEYAYLLAGRLGAQLTLFHSYPLKTGSPFQSLDMILELEQQAARDARVKLNEYLNAALETFADYPEVSVEQATRLGFAVENVIAMTETGKYDLIVMGTKGAGNAADKFLGTNTASVLENVSTPVLAVPHDAGFKGIKKIALAIEPQQELPADLPALPRVLRETDAELHVLHVADNAEDSITTDEAENERKKIAARLQYDKVFVKVEINPHVDEGVSAYAAEHDIDLVAMVVHHRNIFNKIFFPSLTRQTVMHTRLPLLAMHAAD